MCLERDQARVPPSPFCRSTYKQLLTRHTTHTALSRSQAEERRQEQMSLERERERRCYFAQLSTFSTPSNTTGGGAAAGADAA